MGSVAPRHEVERLGRAPRCRLAENPRAGGCVCRLGCRPRVPRFHRRAVGPRSTGVLPYIYAVGLLSAYELAFLRIGWKSDRGWWARTRAKLALLASFHVKARDVGDFSGPWQFKLASATSFSDARRVIGEFRQAQ